MPQTRFYNQKTHLAVDELVFIISMGFALNPGVASFEMPSIIPYCFFAVWVCLSLFKASNSKLVKDYGLKPLGIRLAAPKVAMLVLSVALFVFKIARFGLVGGANQILAFAIPIAAVYLFGSKTIDLIFYSCLVSMAFVVPFIMLLCGPSSIFGPIYSLFDPMALNPFETSQFTFTASYLCVYYCCIDKRKSTGKALGSLLMCFMGFKRIVLLAFCFAFLLDAVLKRLSFDIRKSTYIAIMTLVGIGCFAFVALMFSGFIENVMSLLSINVMGRNYYWQVAIDNSVFSLAYLGQGVNTLQKLLTTTYSYLHVGGVHCDILKMYFELGFIGFVLWLYYYLLYLPKWLLGKGATCTFEAYALITIFQFVLFVTDNVDIYLGSQLVYCAIPLVLWMNEVNLHGVPESASSDSDHSPSFKYE